MRRVKLSIIIVNCDTEEVLKECLASLSGDKLGLPLEIIVVDNASRDGSVSMVSKEFSHVKLIKNSENVGFARANNQGIRASSGEYALLLNTDAIIRDITVLRRWLDFMDSHPDAAASGCKLVFPDGAHQVGDAGFKPSLSTVINYSFFLSKIFPYRFKGLFLNYAKYTGEVEVDWISGAALMVRSSILEKVGLLDEGTFMFAEDIEWGCRMKSSGYGVFYLPYLEIVHLQGASMERQRDKTGLPFLWLKNLRRLYLCYSGKDSAIAYDLAMAAGFLLRTFFYYLIYLKTKDIKNKLKSEKLSRYTNFTLRNLGKPINEYGSR